jgi:hypothetical protein
MQAAIKQQQPVVRANAVAGPKPIRVLLVDEARRMTAFVTPIELHEGARRVVTRLQRDRVAHHVTRVVVALSVHRDEAIAK